MGQGKNQMSKQLETLNKLIGDAQEIFSKAKDEGRELSKEEIEKKNEFMARAKAMKETIEGEKELAALNFHQAVKAEALTQAKDSKAEKEQPKQADEKALFNRYLKTGKVPAGLKVEGDGEDFTITTSTASGVIVPRSVETPVIVRRMWNAILNACLSMGQPIVGMDSDSTETIVLPVVDDSSVSGRDAAENETSDQTGDPDLTNTISLGATLNDSKTLWFSNTQLKSLPYDLASYLMPILDKRIELKQDSDWTTKLLVPQASGNTVTTASTTGITYAEFNAFYHKLAAQFRTDGVFIASDGFVQLMEGLTDDNHRPLFSNENSIEGAVGKLRGKPLFISNSLQAPGAGVVSAVFVSSSALYPRVCGNKRIAVYQNLPDHRDQVGYAEFVNSDFGVVSAAVAYLKHAAS
jgi:HK97 family phage major capsid protein